MTTQKNQPGLYAKLAEAMDELRQFEKSGYNSFQKYNFVRADDVTGTIRKLLAARGIVFSPRMMTLERSPQGEKQVHVLISWEMTFIDAATTERHSCSWWSESLDTGDKGINKAATQAVKYFLLKFFLAGDDQDGDETDEQVDAANIVATSKDVQACKKFFADAGIEWDAALERAGVSGDRALLASDIAALRKVAGELSKPRDGARVVRESFKK